MTQPIIQQIHSFLIKKHKTVAIAESCTGGLASQLLTNLPGSSKYFILGVVAYSNRVKTGILHIPATLITKKGAVSPEVARKMAQGVRKLAKTDFGIGITGIAGPSGGTKAKPVGTVFIAVTNIQKTLCRELHFRGIRSLIRKQAAIKALKLLAKAFK